MQIPIYFLGKQSVKSNDLRPVMHLIYKKNKEVLREADINIWINYVQILRKVGNMLLFKDNLTYHCNLFVRNKARFAVHSLKQVAIDLQPPEKICSNRLSKVPLVTCVQVYILCKFAKRLQALRDIMSVHKS